MKMLTALVFVLSVLVPVESAREAHEHRVHDLLLYPDAQEWCEGMSIEMILTHPGCQPLTLANRVCAGQCFSYTPPRTRPANRMEDQLQHCSHCVPSNVTWQQVVFDCDTERYQSFTKEVEIIHQCACSPCFPDNQLQQKQKSMFDNYIYEYDAADDVNVDDYEDVDVNERMAQRVVHDGVDAALPARGHDEHVGDAVSLGEQVVDAAAVEQRISNEPSPSRDDVIMAKHDHGHHSHHRSRANVHVEPLDMNVQAHDAQVLAHVQAHNVHVPASRADVQERDQVDGFT